MRQITVNLYNFDELNDDAKQKSIDKHREFLSEVMSLDYITDDAKTIGLNITGWDLYHRSIDGELTEELPEVVKLIKENHGSVTPTYQLAERYKNKHGYDAEETFSKELMQLYLAQLHYEYEYQLEDAQIIESITINEYEFTEKGELA